ncbi:MAG TPA: hypothetical protein VIY49_06305 [Bryobacteraceae bacterium]
MTYSDWRQLVSLEEGDEFRIQSPPSDSAPEATVHFPLRLVAWLNEAIQDGSTLEPPREAGGVLVGAISPASKSSDGSAPDVSVELFLPIDCHDSGGPLYHLSESDKEAMREHLKGVGVSSMVVGLYRTNFRPAVELDEADEALAAELLTHPGSLFLIVKPDASDGPQATLFLRGAESICREPALTFPFDYVELNRLKGDRAVVDREPPAQAVSYPEETSSWMAAVHQEPPAQTAGPIRRLLAKLPPSPVGRKWVLAGGMAALLALAFAAGKTWVARRPAGAAAQAPATDVRSGGIFDLKAAMEQDHLRITWDPRALPIDAREGAMLITDGEMRTQIPMDASAVSQGSVEYYPKSAFLRLELRIANLSDMVMVAGLNAADPLASPSPVTQIAKNEAPRAKASSPPQSQQLPPSQPAASQAAPAPQSSASQSTPASQPPGSQPARAPQTPAAQPAATSQSPGSQPDPDPETPGSQPAPAAKQFELPRSGPPPSTPVLSAAAALPQTAVSPPVSLPQTIAPGLNPPPTASASQSTPPPAQPAPAKPVAQSTPPPVQTTPAKPEALSTPSVQIAPPPTNSPADFAVAQVKERVLPTVSANVLRLISPSVVVHVKVQIDDRGKVVKSESLTHGPGLVDTLADAAVEAARHWQFVPARRGNQNVASETVLNFTFARGN